MEFVGSIKIWAVVAAVVAVLLTALGQHFVYRKYGLNAMSDKLRRVYWPLTNALAAACIVIAIGIGTIAANPIDSRWAEGVAPLIHAPQVGGDGPIGSVVKSGLQPLADDLAKQANDSLKPVQAVQGAQALIGNLFHVGIVLIVPLAFLVIVGAFVSVVERRTAPFKVRVQAGEIRSLKKSVTELQRAVFPHKFH